MAIDQALLQLIDQQEGAGNYDTLFGHAQRPGGAFAGLRPSTMSIREVMELQNPEGPYANYVKGHVGRIATPVGRYQVVGTTLRDAVRELGLDPAEEFDSDTQDQIAGFLAQRRLAAAGPDPTKRRAGLRAEWEGLKNVPDDALDAALMGGGLASGGLGDDQKAGMTQRMAGLGADKEKTKEDPEAEGDAPMSAGLKTRRGIAHAVGLPEPGENDFMDLTPDQETPEGMLRIGDTAVSSKYAASALMGIGQGLSSRRSRAVGQPRTVQF